MKKILIAEDDDAIAMIEKDYLTLYGFSVEIANDGRKALTRALQGDFDLILLDVMLPSLDGFAICEELRKHLDVPIIFVTAKTGDLDKIRGLGLGGDDYVEKPFSPSVLVARVKSRLAEYERLKPGEGERKKLVEGNIVLDLGSHTLSVDGKSVELKNKEYELLSFLMINKDILYTKEDLYERLWGMEALGDSQTVVVHINRLREKIEKDPANPVHLINVRNGGYSFR